MKKEPTILPRVEIIIKENNNNQVYKMFQDWITLTNIKEEMNLKPNVITRIRIPWTKISNRRNQ